MSFSYTTPTGLTGVPAALSIPLTWNPSSLISGGSSLLLHMDGVNGATSFPDSSGNSLNGAANSNVAVSTADFMFGNASALFSPKGAGSLGYISVPFTNAGPIDISSGDFTIEFWLKVGTQVAGGSNLVYFAHGSGSLSDGPVLQVLTPAAGIWSVICGASGSWSGLSVQDALGVALSPNTWTHIAAVMHGGIMQVYIGGQAISAGGQVWTPGSMAADTQFIVGTFPNVGVTQGLVGNVDELRITKLALYTANFTPPSAPFAGSAPVGYDVYRNGVSVAQYFGSPGYTDSVPGTGIYTYNVAASDGISTDLSDLSAPFTVAIGQIGGIQGKFVPAPAFKAIMAANPGLINPRIYPPLDDNTVRVKP